MSDGCPTRQGKSWVRSNPFIINMCTVAYKFIRNHMENISKANVFLTLFI